MSGRNVLAVAAMYSAYARSCTCRCRAPARRPVATAYAAADGVHARFPTRTGNRRARGQVLRAAPVAHLSKHDGNATAEVAGVAVHWSCGIARYPARSPWPRGVFSQRGRLASRLQRTTSLSVYTVYYTNPQLAAIGARYRRPR